MTSTGLSTSTLPRTQAEWRAALSALPATPGRIPAFYFADGSPMLAFSDTAKNYNTTSYKAAPMHVHGPRGTLAAFLRDFGRMLLPKYRPRGIVVFSAHWDTTGERLGTDYGEENPLLYDYYGYDREYYELQFKTRDDTALSHHVVELFRAARGRDGRGYVAAGIDQGVFLPFRHMFGNTFWDVPIVQASFDGSLSPEGNWMVGRAIKQLRQEGILVLAGGLTLNNWLDTTSFVEDTAELIYKVFDRAVLEAMTIRDAAERRLPLMNLVDHPGFCVAHSHADHFIPIFVAVGAGEDGDAQVLNASYGIHTYAFGL